MYYYDHMDFDFLNSAEGLKAEFLLDNFEIQKGDGVIRMLITYPKTYLSYWQLSK